MLAGIVIPLFADFFDTVVPIIIFVIYGISQLLSGRKEKKQKAPRPRNPRPPLNREGAPQGAAPAAPPPNQADSLRREVEEFLQRAQGQPKKQPEPARRATKPSQLQPQSQARKQTRRPVTARSTPRPAAARGPLTAAEPFLTPMEPSNLRREGVAEHVAKHIQSEELGEHAEHLGDEIALAEERIEARLHEKFDHQLGDLGRQEESADSGPTEPDIAAQIAAMLSNPSGMRQLIVAQEILRRPDHW